jgi:hypothetical protein
LLYSNDPHIGHALLMFADRVRGQLRTKPPPRGRIRIVDGAPPESYFRHGRKPAEFLKDERMPNPPAVPPHQHGDIRRRGVSEMVRHYQEAKQQSTKTLMDDIRSRLSPRQWRVYKAANWDGLGSGEIARRERMHPQNVQRIIKQCERKLKRTTPSTV